MDKKILGEWEKYLETPKHEKYIKNRKNLSNRFGKNKLLDLFENGKLVLETKNKGYSDRFKITFISQVLNPIKEIFGMEYVKKHTYSSLMSIFSKFIYFLREIQKKQEQNLNIDLDNGKNIQTETKKEVLDLLELRDDEINFISIDNEGNILPPKSAGEFRNNERLETKKDGLYKKKVSKQSNN